MIKKIRFKNYKAFPREEELDLRPVTLIIGKNSSGKSSILKLFPLLTSMMNEANWIPSLEIDGISYGGSYQDLFYRNSNTGLKLGVEYDNGLSIDVEYLNDKDGFNIFDYVISYMDNKIMVQKQRLGEVVEMQIEEFLDANRIPKDDVKIALDYIGPLRTMAPSNVRFRGFSLLNKVGYNGSGAYDILLNSYIKGLPLFKDVSTWMQENLEGQKIEFSNSSNNSGNYTLWVKRKGAEVNIAEVGQGIAQVLPIITLAISAKEGSINVMEQPELHLHPAAHAHIAEVVGKSAKQNNSTFIIESHSKNILLGFQKMIVDKDIDFHPEDIAIYFVSELEDGSSLHKINVDEKGEFDDWPLGVFSESFELAREINDLLL